MHLLPDFRAPWYVDALQMALIPLTHHHMYRIIYLWWILLASTNAFAEPCPLPTTGAGEPYLTLADLPNRELRVLLNEYMFVHSWTTHAEAVAAGFRLGDQVYGQILKSGSKFRPEKTDAWRRAYRTSERREFFKQLPAQADPAALSPAVVDWTLRVCLARGIWSKVKVLNDCRFVFAAGAVADDTSSSKVRPLRFEVHGARCAGWPRRPLSSAGDEVQCVRSGDSEVSLELATDRAGITRQSLPAINHIEVPPEPVQEQNTSRNESEIITLSKSRDYFLFQLGKGCPHCALYAADVRPSEPGALILRATTVSSTRGGWQPCPAGLRCGVQEFSPPDNSLISGCEGLAVCRVWRLAETDADASDVIQLDYQKAPRTACRNCPINMDFESAHKQWMEQREKALARCETFADSPAQTIAPGPTN